MRPAQLAKSLLFAGILIPFAGFATNPSVPQHPNGPVSSSTATPKVTDYLEQAKIRQTLIDVALAPIKSQSDLQAYLTTHRLGSSPLDELSLGAKQRFLASLQFNENGLTTFEYIDLENELTPTQIYRILSLFGAQRDTVMMRDAARMTQTDWLIMGASQDSGPGQGAPGDYQGYKCVSRANCFEMIHYICITANC